MSFSGAPFTYNGLSVSKSEAFLQGQWVSIEPPDTSTGVLFAGDMLERITNGKAGRTPPKPRVGLGTFLESKVLNGRYNPLIFHEVFPLKINGFFKMRFLLLGETIFRGEQAVSFRGRVNGFTGFTHLLCMVEVLQPFLFWLRWCLDIGHSTCNHPITVVVGWRNPSMEFS